MKTQVLVAALAAAGMASGANAALIDVDFAGDSAPAGESAPWGGGGDIGAAAGFVEATASEIGPTAGLTPQAGPVSVTDGGITVSVDGPIGGWGGNAGGGDALHGDYLFLGSGTTHNWSISGLAASTSYVVTFYHGENQSGRNVTFDVGGSTAVASVAEQTVTLNVTSDGTGTVAGTALGGGAEGNWAGVSVDVPEPGSLALLGLGGLAMLRRRRA